MSKTYPIYPNVSRSQAAPGGFTNVAIACAALAVGTGGELSLNTSDKWIDYLQSRTPIQFMSSPSFVIPGDVRSPVQHLENIKSILAPSITDLGQLVGVTRQSVHKWIAGGNLDEEHAAKITEISKIADRVSAAKLSQPQWLVKMKIFDGESLVDLISDSRWTDEHVEALILEASKLEGDYKNSGIYKSNTTPTDNWKSDSSIPYLDD